jgi:hypothetical protein
MQPAELLKYLNNLTVDYPQLYEASLWVVFFALLYFYGRLRKAWWRKILGASLDYHKFHLAAMQSDKGIDEKTREFSVALLWAINKQLPSDLSNGGGGALWRSFLGQKTALNTCGSIFYEASRYARFIDLKIFKLNDTLLSTFYRIFFLESVFFPAAILLMDIFFLISLIRKPDSGASRLYIEMKKDISA